MTDYTALVARAMGMVSVQADCTVEEALPMMNDRAQVARTTLVEVARAVVDGSIRFGE